MICIPDKILLYSSLWALFGVFCLMNSHVEAVTPSAILSIEKWSDRVMYGAPAAFSSQIKEQWDAAPARLFEPLNDADGCAPTIVNYYGTQTFYLLVSRGTCTFESKAIAAYLLGAKGVVVYNSLQGIYGGRNYSAASEYECDNGASYVAELKYPLYGDEMNALMPEECTKDSRCASGKCVVTNDTVHKHYGHRVCCAWDLYMTMGRDETAVFDPNIPVIAIRMQDYDMLSAMSGLATQTLKVQIYARDSLFDHASVFIIYIVAVGTVLYASGLVAEKDRVLNSTHETSSVVGGSSVADEEYQSSLRDVDEESSLLSDDLHSDAGSAASSSMYERQSSLTGNESICSNNNDVISNGENTSILSRASSAAGGKSSGGGLSAGYRKVDQYTSASTPKTDPHKFEIGTWAAVFYVVACSLFIVMMYYFSVTKIVALAYLCFAAVAFYLLVFFPFWEGVAKLFFSLRTGKPMGEYYHAQVEARRHNNYDAYGGNSPRNRNKSNYNNNNNSSSSSSPVTSPPDQHRQHHQHRTNIGEDYNATHEMSQLQNPFSAILQTPAKLMGVLCTTAAIFLWFQQRKSSSYWVWVGQDLMGVAVAIVCLDNILFPNLKVAVVFLSLAFCYDIFFVFGSTYFFNTSIMEQVAVGTAAVNDDENFCEKYPDDETYCSFSTLPMVLYVPALDYFTFTETDSMLGLGDIILPGLLAVWAARHDMRKYGVVVVDNYSYGYYSFAMAGYAIGLLLADCAAVYFETGQPALMYVVPCMLLPILIRAFRSDTLAQLWQSLPSMKIVALPMSHEEQQSLLANSEAVQVEAEWGQKTGSIFVVDSSLVEGAGAHALFPEKVNAKQQQQQHEKEEYHGTHTHNSRPNRGKHSRHGRSSSSSSSTSSSSTSPRYGSMMPAVHSGLPAASASIRISSAKGEEEVVAGGSKNSNRNSNYSYREGSQATSLSSPSGAEKTQEEERLLLIAVKGNNNSTGGVDSSKNSAEKRSRPPTKISPISRTDPSSLIRDTPCTSPCATTTTTTAADSAGAAKKNGPHHSTLGGASGGSNYVEDSLRDLL